jgi:hypothetical protein
VRDKIHARQSNVLKDASNTSDRIFAPKLSQLSAARNRRTPLTRARKHDLKIMKERQRSQDSLDGLRLLPGVVQREQYSSKIRNVLT